MSIFKAYVSWSVGATMEVEADSMEDAIQLLKDSALPTDSDYLEDSFQIDTLERV